MSDGNDDTAVRGPMTDADLLELLRRYELAAMGSSVAAGATITTTVFPSNQVLATLEVDRYNALNRYLARPQGDEIEDRSQVVMPVLRDTLHWMLPQLMRIFVASKYVCRFEPESLNDEQQAEMETAYVSHVFMNENDGFKILYDFFHDALLMRNGYVQVCTVEEEYVQEERYSGLTQIELASTMQPKSEDEKVEVLGQKEYMALVMGQPVPVFDIQIRRSGTRQKVKVTCLPPEEMRISPRATEGLEGVLYSAHVVPVPRSDLISQGYPKEWVNSLQAGRPNWMEMDAIARSQVVDQLSIENVADYAMQEVELRRVMVKVDFDGDGIAELRRVIIGGDKIFENEVIEETEFVSCEGMRMPHRHTGMNIDDLVGDLQVLQTQLWRAAIDNLRIAQNSRVAVDWRNVNLDDLMTTRPGAPIRGNGPPSGWILPIEMPSNLTEQTMPALAYTDQLRSNRTGIGKGTMGLDADELQNVTKGGQLASMSAASLILELIARHLGEGVKGIMQKVRSEIIRHQDQPTQFQYAGKWVEIDPSSWKPSRRISVAVGLGSGNSEERRANAMMLAQMMQAVTPAGLVGPKQMWEAFRYGVEGLGINNPERYAMDPASPEYQQHMQQMQQMQAMAPPAPQVQAAKIRAQTELTKQQAENARAQGELQQQVMEGRLQLIHEAIQQKDQQIHDTVQGHKDRENEIRGHDKDILLALIKAYTQIISAEKGSADELAGDVAQGESQLG